MTIVAAPEVVMDEMIELMIGVMGRKMITVLTATRLPGTRSAAAAPHVAVVTGVGAVAAQLV
jgi:hypothetical protein